MAYKKKTNFRRGMPVGSSHNWNYVEHSYKSKGKNFIIEQSKGRNTSSPKGSGMPLRSKLRWQITGIERIGKPRKVKGYKGYMTPITITGIKKQGAFKLPNKKWVNSKLKRRPKRIRRKLKRRSRY